MSYKSTLLYEPIRSIDSATFTGSYQAIGTPITNAASIIKIVNNSTVLVTISIDGTNDHDILPAGSFFLYDITSDSPFATGGVFKPAGTKFFAKGSAGTGSVYLVVQYVPVG